MSWFLAWIRRFPAVARLLACMLAALSSVTALRCARFVRLAIAPARSRSRRCAQRGMVTAELAVAILAACLLTGILGWTVSLVALQARCADAAGQIARQLARGDQEAAREAEERIPDGAQLKVEESATEVTVLVTVEAHWGTLGPVEITGRASSPGGGR